jgi:hypothetical protein
MGSDTRAPEGRAIVTGDDLIVIAPWLVFGAGLVLIGFRLLAQRGTRRQSPPRPPAQPGRPEDAPPAGRSLQPGTKPASGTQADERGTADASGRPSTGTGGPAAGHFR